MDTGRLIYFGFFCAGCAVAAILIYLAYQHRRRHAANLMRGILEDYFEEKIGVDELARNARAAVGHRFLGGNESFAGSVRAFQNAAERLPPNYLQKDADKLLGLLAALRNEFGLADRYQIEGWRAGRE